MVTEYHGQLARQLFFLLHNKLFLFVNLVFDYALQVSATLFL